MVAAITFPYQFRHTLFSLFLRSDLYTEMRKMLLQFTVSPSIVTGVTINIYQSPMRKIS